MKKAYFGNKCAYKIIGTVVGGGYDCRSGKVAEYYGHKGGIWNKVSHWVDWIRQQMEAADEPICSPQ